MAPIVKYETTRFNLTPMVEGPYVGYGPEVDKAWDGIANDSMSSSPCSMAAHRGIPMLT